MKTNRLSRIQSLQIQKEVFQLILQEDKRKDVLEYLQDIHGIRPSGGEKRYYTAIKDMNKCSSFENRHE